MTRRSLITGSTIIIVWLVTMGFLFRSYYLQRAAPPAYTTESLFGSVEAISRWRDVEEYMMIVSSGNNGKSRNPVGATATTIRRVDNPTTTVAYRAHFNLEGKLAPLMPKAVVKVVADLDKGVTLTSFHGITHLGPLALESTGFVRDRILYISVANGSDVSKSKVALQNSISMAEALRPILSRQMKIETGSKMSTPIIDPLTGLSRGTLAVEIQMQEEISVNGKEMQAFRVESSIGDIQTLMWINPEGQILRRQLLGNLFMERTTKEEALKQAPSLAEKAEIQGHNIAEFADVPFRGSEETKENQPGGLAIIQGLLR